MPVNCQRRFCPGFESLFRPLGAYTPKNEFQQIKEIAETTGFPDQNYFSRIFKKSSGISPLAFRKRHLQ